MNEQGSAYKMTIGNETCIKSVIAEAGYQICHSYTEGKKTEVKTDIGTLNLSGLSTQFLGNKGFTNLWCHQALAIEEAIAGKNVCITTSTSSGKTEIFQIAALEALSKSGKAKVLAVYPMKALNRQQVERWQKAIPNIGKIDGDTKDFGERMRILQDCQVVVMTPDVLHTYLLSRVFSSVF